MNLLDFFRGERRKNAVAVKAAKPAPRRIGWQQGSTLLKLAHERERREHPERITPRSKCHA